MNIQPLYAYRFVLDSFNAKLESFHLLYNYELPLSTSISSLINTVASHMQSSPFNYQFRSSSSTFLLSHETLPLQLLEIVNRGVPRATDGQIRLRRTAHRLLTLGDLATNRMHFAVPDIAIEGNQFVVHFGTLFRMLFRFSENLHSVI